MPKFTKEEELKTEDPNFQTETDKIKEIMDNFHPSEENTEQKSKTDKIEEDLNYDLTPSNTISDPEPW